MEDLIDLMVGNESPSEISDKLKEILMQKAGTRVDELRPHVAASIFDNGVENEEGDSGEVQTDQLDQEEE
jgi:hypothetical protein